MSNRNSNSNNNNRRRPHDGNVGPRTQHDEDDYREEDVEEDEGENMHNDFSSGKNPTRQAASRRVAQERGHEAFAEMGRKGGKANAGIHADVDYDNPEHDDEGGVPAKNPNRVRGGKQAAKTREEHGNMSMSEMGRMGGQSNRGKSHLTQSNYDDEDGDYNDHDNKNPNRVRGGQQAASKRSHEDFVEMGRKGGRSSNGGNSQSGSRQSGGNSQSGNRQSGGQSSQNRSASNRQSGGNQSHSTPPRDALGHFVSTKNSNQRNSSGNNRNSSGNGRGRQGSNQYQRKGDDDEDDDEDNEDNEDNEDEETGDNAEGKNPNRVRGGKRAASHRSHEDFVRMGKMGAEARWGHSYDNNDNDEDNEDHDDHEDDNDNGDNNEGKNPNRVRGGKQAAAKRSHEDFVEMGRKGGRSNQGRSKSSNNNDDDDDEDDDDHDNRRNSNKRRRSNQQSSQSSYSPAKMFTY